MNGAALILALLVIVIAFIFLVRVLFHNTKNGILFHPVRSDVEQTHPILGVDRYLGDVHTRYYQVGSEPAERAILFLHGNSGNISDRSYMVEFATLCGLDLLLVDYRGYGQSKGNPSIERIQEDGLVAFDHLSQQYGPRIIVMSESLGSIALSAIANQRVCELYCIICGISSFESIRQNSQLPGTIQMIARLATPSLDTKSNVKLLANAKAPVLFVHSREDELVPYACCVENNAVVPSEYQRGILTIEGGHACPIFTDLTLHMLLQHMQVDRPIATFRKWKEHMKNIGNNLMLFRIDMP